MGSESEDNSYCLIFNIPLNYRSKHLRNFFNELIERKVFNCFHYRHRQQNWVLVNNNSDNSSNSNNSYNKLNNSLNVNRFCAIIDIKTAFLSQFLDKYNKKFWINFDNECDYDFKCFIKLIKIKSDFNSQQNSTQSMY